MAKKHKICNCGPAKENVPGIKPGTIKTLSYEGIEDSLKKVSRRWYVVNPKKK